MIELKNVSKSYSSKLFESVEILKNINIKIEREEKIGLLGLNGAGKTSLCKILCGSEPATDGEIEIHGTTSWPIGIFDSLSPNLSGVENIVFICTVFDIDPNPLIKQIRKVSKLEDMIYKPVSTYSSGMRARLAFFLAFSIDFDFYVCDEITSVGDKNFSSIADQFFSEVIKERGLILCSHITQKILKNVDKVFILHGGTISEKFPVHEGIDYYNHLVNENS